MQAGERSAELSRAAAEPRPLEAQAVTINRDERGVPHIQAETLEGALYGLGYAQAEDRLFQMEMRRSFVAGRLGERFAQPGVDTEALLENDIKMKVLGYERSAVATYSKMPRGYQRQLRAYAAGVNAQVAERRGDLGEAFERFGIDGVEPWRPSDSLLVWDFFTHKFGGPLKDMTNELDAQIDCEDGCDAPKCPAVVDEDAAVVPPPLTASLPGVLPGGRSASFADLGFRPGVNLKASHGAVVSAELMEGNAPALFAEPQILLEAPSIWHEHHLVVAREGVNTRGVGVAGAPGFMVFWNKNAAQTLTAGAGDIADLFEIVPGRAPDTYIVDGRTLDMDVSRELILVRGGDPVEITIRETVFGPIVNDALMPTGGSPSHVARRELLERSTFAMRHAESFEEESHSILAALDLIKVKSLREYQSALERWVGPTVNALYAGVDAGTGESHIAFHALVGIAERELLIVDGLDLTGQHPYDGGTVRSDWSSILDLEWNPQVVDPPQGYLLSGNHLPVGRWYDDVVYTGLGGNGDTFRSLQVRVELEALAAQDTPLSPRALHGLHFNTQSWAALRYLDVLRLLELRGLLPRDAAGRAPVTRLEKAARVKAGLERWATEGGGELDQRAVGAPLANKVLSGLVTNSRVSKDENVPAEQEFGCTWGGAEGGASHFLKAFADDPSALGRLEIGLVLETAESAWDGVVAAGLPVDVRRWEGLDEPVPTTVHYQRNFFCFFGPGACSIDDDLAFEADIFASYLQTISSTAGSSYPATVFFSDINRSRALLPPGASERPDARHFDSALALIEAKGEGDQRSIPVAPLDQVFDGRPVTLEVWLP